MIDGFAATRAIRAVDGLPHAEVAQAAAAHKLAGIAGMFGEGGFGAMMSDLEVGLSRWAMAERPLATRAAYQGLQRWG